MLSRYNNTGFFFYANKCKRLHENLKQNVKIMKQNVRKCKRFQEILKQKCKKCKKNVSAYIRTENLHQLFSKYLGV